MPTLGLVLSGGAARGAYEAGVLRFIYQEFPKHLGFEPWPDVVSGTSVGALNGMFPAARLADGVVHMSQIWRDLAIEQVFQMRSSGVFAAIASAVREGPFSLLDATPLMTMVRREFPQTALRAAIDSGVCRAYIVSTTAVESGANVLFADTAYPRFDDSPSPGTEVVRTRLRPRHFLASASLPFLFPAVPISGHYYVDGGLRLNTPLRPVIRAGADRAIVVGAKRSIAGDIAAPLENVTPNLTFLAGKTLNALLLDPVERDRWEMERVNAIIAWGVKQYGADFAQKIAADLNLRFVETLVIRPSVDLGALAAERYREKPPKTTGAVRLLMNLVHDRVNAAEADLLSYLYFDAGFTGELEQRGYDDAMAQQEALAKFLEPHRPV